MNSSVCDNISEFFVVVGVPEKEIVVFWKIEYVGEGIEGVETLLSVGFFARALELIANGNFKLGAVNVFEDEAGSSGDAHEVVFDFPLEEHFDLLNLKLHVLLCICFRHPNINIILSSSLSSIKYYSILYQGWSSDKRHFI